ncbi:ead/Ea22-like family protein [Klebsiella pneumoniae]|uniref:ead/Ea22-like family protein n=1 Tax=Klebsiella pneumoniae TaxID=573 RepID=UPI001F05DA7E|nr:ead/Ea22-like family protein [Klebsiella pneumoniae]MCH0792058.1 ead/Ea22-like family protein [Klebsiella pneumoniae]
MTDITELAQSLKAAAENAIGAHERLAAYPYDEIIDISQHEGEQIDIDITDLNEFNKEANPENILALVEALEKAQQVDEELCKLLPPGVEYMDPPDGGDVTPLEGVRRMVADYRQRIAELESRTVKLSPELYTIGDLIRTQDNRITDQPMFVVFQKREIIGSDEHSPSRICWVWDGEEVSELRAKRLEALYQDGRDTRGYDRYAMQEVDEFVTACFTEHGCKDYLRQNGHNLRLPYIYACGSFRNNEYQLVRNWLAGIKVEAE